jgi:hypothetical protein
MRMPHHLLFDPHTREGRAIHDLFTTIKNEIEESDRNWNGGDVVQLLTRWFIALGYDVDAPAPTATN